ncbi:MAG: hypothetical protein K9M98_13495 [Cephaloticoccus sp.]|nr:hypothetical protein [Cephaloticoccus sp.]MCF7761507.1 hypothetical protein [Cephaloticoccus sp.]
MSGLRLRPSFSHELAFTIEAARQRIVDQVAQDAARCELKSFPGFICLRIPESDRHFWSPRLNLSLEKHAGGHTQVHGLYGPNANMWSSFLYGYLIIGSVGMFAGILGGCQCVLGQPAWGLWILGTMLVIAAGMLLAARIGQRLAAPQMALLHAIYESAVGQKVSLE